MSKWNMPVLVVTLILATFILGGCVERELTINTEPAGALVTLNDEEIGESPVTVSFNWYGDYRVRIVKNGYQTLNTHCELKGPWYDKFPFDFFAQIVSPKQKVDSYQWNFELAEYTAPERDELIKNAEKMKAQVEAGQIPAEAYVK